MVGPPFQSVSPFPCCRKALEANQSDDVSEGRIYGQPRSGHDLKEHISTREPAMMPAVHVDEYFHPGTFLTFIILSSFADTHV